MKLRTHIALALLVAAVSVPASHAAVPTLTSPNDRSGALGLGAASVAPDAVDRYLRNHDPESTADTSDVVSRYLRNHTQASRTDTSDAVSRYLRNHTQASRMDTSDVVSRYVLNHTQALAATTLPTRNGAGFDWADAGIGAGGMLGIMLLAGTAALLMRHGRRRLTSAY